MYNRQVKFGLKIPNCFGKTVRKKSGGMGLTHTVVGAAAASNVISAKLTGKVSDLVLIVDHVS